MVEAARYREGRRSENSGQSFAGTAYSVHICLSKFQHGEPLSEDDKRSLGFGARYLGQVFDGGYSTLPATDNYPQPVLYNKRDVQAYASASHAWKEKGKLPHDRDQLSALYVEHISTLNDIMVGNEIDPARVTETNEFFLDVFRSQPLPNRHPLR